jgi:hypothetical protein
MKRLLPTSAGSAFAAVTAGLIFGAAHAPAASDMAGRAVPEWDELFQRTSGWTGADGNFSVPLSRETTLWLFGDTWMGEVKDGRRTNMTLVNNSIALQRGRERPEFFYGTSDGKPSAFVTPKDGHGYFWPFHGARTEDGLHVFLQQVENVTGKPDGPFNFRMTSTWLGHVSNPDDPPQRWKIEQEKVPFSEFGTNGDLLLGSWLLRQDGQIYIFGLDSRDKKAGRKNSLVVARAPEGELGRFTSWQFFGTGGWQSGTAKLAPLAPGFPTEFSVTYWPARRQYAAVYVEGAISGRICLRLAPAVTGPWGEPRVIYECPEKGWPEAVFCYSAKAHPELAASPEELLITYAANSWQLGNVVNDARLYWPRFVRVNSPAIP